jgi:hypothetical protein
MTKKIANGTEMKIKSEMHLNSVLALMRKAQKEAKRFPSKGNIATAKYWEGIIDRYLESAEKDNCRTVLKFTKEAS